MPAVPTDHWQNLQYASVRTSSLGPERSDRGPGRSIRSSDRTMLAPAALGRMRPRSSDGSCQCQCQWAVSARLDAWAGGRMIPVERGRAPCSALQAESQLTQPLT